MDRFFNCVYCFNAYNEKLVKWHKDRDQSYFYDCRLLSHRLKNKHCSKDIYLDTTAGELSNCINYYTNEYHKLLDHESISGRKLNLQQFMTHIGDLHRHLIRLLNI